MSRVAITGVGVVSPLASDADRHFDELLLGRSGVRPCDPGDAALIGVPGWARVRDFDHRAMPRTRMLRKVLRPSAAYAVAAAGEALGQAGLRDDPRLFDAGLFVGSASVEPDGAAFLAAVAASLDSDARFDLSSFAKRGRRHVDPLLIVKGLPNAGLCGVAIEHGVKGPNLNLSSGVSSGLQAFMAAWASVRAGRTRLALAGGYDSRCTVDLVAAHRAAGELSDTAALAGLGARPFARARDGFVPGEGAAFCVLEPEALARARGAQPLAILHDARRGFCPSDDAGERARMLAELVTELCAPRPQLVFATGIGTLVGDALEAAVIRTAWPRPPLVTATTGATGFLGAAAGVLSLVHACQSFARGQVPPTLGCDAADPALGLAVVNTTRALDIDRALVLASHGHQQLAIALGGAS